MSANVKELRDPCGLSARDRHERGDAGPRNGVLGTLRRLGRSLASARRRRLAIADLSRLDDRALDDIGLRREQIPEVVDRTMGRGL